MSHTTIFKIGNWGIPWWSSELQASTAGGVGSIPGWRTKLLQTPAKAQPKIINKYYIHIEIHTHTHTHTYIYVVVHSPSCVRLFVTPWTTARQVSLSLTISQSLPKFKSIKSVVPSNHFILLPSSPPAFSFSQHHELALCVRWPKYWSFSLSIQ